MTHKENIHTSTIQAAQGHLSLDALSYFCFLVLPSAVSEVGMRDGNYLSETKPLLMSVG